LRAWSTRFDTLPFVPRLLLALAGGFVVASGAPRDGILVLCFVGWVPLIALALRSHEGAGRTALVGWVGGLGIGLGGFPWISAMLVQFAGVPTPVGWLGLFLFASWMAVPYAAFALLLRFGPRDGTWGFVWAMAAYVATQASWPVLFPYTVYLGFAEQPALLQAAEWIGVHGIEALVVGAQIALCRALFTQSLLGRIGYAALWLAVPLAMLGLGQWRMGQIDRAVAGGPFLRVAVVQPNVGIFQMSTHRQLARLSDPSYEAATRGAQLLVWPEAGTFPYSVGRPFTDHVERVAQRVLRRHRIPTLFGAGSRVPGERFGYNSTFLIDGDGNLLGEYDKVNLVPLGEYIPLIDPHWVTDRVGNIAHHQPGEAPARFEIPRASDERSLAFAPLICYEDIIASYVREAAAQPGGVELFVNQTIDAWYGDSAEPWQHLALAQWRAVEHRVPLVRSVSTGVSAVVDANGRLLSYLPHRPVTPETLDAYPPEVLVETISLARNTEDDATFYARAGWLLPHVCQIAVVAGLVSWRRRRASGV